MTFIDDRKETGKTSAASAEPFGLLAENSTDMISKHTPEGVYTHASPACRNLLGYEPEELLGRSVYEFFHPEDLKRVSNAHSRGQERPDIYTVSYRIRRKNGTYICLETTSSTVRDPETSKVLEIIAVSRGATERKRIDEALRKSEEFNRFAVQAGRIGTWDLDLQTEECLISPKMAEFMDFSADQTTVPGARWREAVLPEDRDSMASALAGSIESDAPFDLEFRIARKDGGERWLYSRGGVSRDASGKALRVHGASIDVTERKQAEEKLRKSEERLRRTIEIETVGVIFFRVDGSITEANDAFLRMSGYSREDLVEGLVRWDKMTPPEWMPHSLKAIEEFESTGRTMPYEKEYVRKDGSRWWALFAATRLDEDEGVELIIDITKSKWAEEELQESNERITNILESITDAFVAVDRQWHFTYLNERALTTLQRTREELLGKNMWEEFPEAVGLPAYREYHRAMTSGTSAHFEEFNPWQGIWVEINAYPSERGLAVYFRDITERKRHEEEIETRSYRQGVVAELGLQALANKDLQTLMDEAVTFVAQTLRVEYAKIVEVLPSGEELLLRAGVGWKNGLVGHTTEDAGHGSQSGYTLLSQEPVVVEDLRTETRFPPPPLLQEHGVVSSITVVIPGRQKPFGALGAHTRRIRAFSDDDVNFLQATANVLATAIERELTENKLEEVREDERYRISRDLHDVVLQDAVAALQGMRAAQIETQGSGTDAALNQEVEAALYRVTGGIRNVIYDLGLEAEQDRPFSQLLISLVDLQRTMAPECDIRLQITDGVLDGPLGEKGREILRIIGEALTNARRHSGARNVLVSVVSYDSRLRVEVADDGRGFDPAEKPSATSGGKGMRGMHERANLLSGDLCFRSEPGRGTKVVLNLTL